MGCMTRGERPDPVLVIGLDGATFALLRPWLEGGELPHLSRLYREGVRGVLESVVPPLSPEAWSTFMTGKHPGQHGVMNFMGLRRGSYALHFNSGAEVQEPSLWRLLSDAGRRVGVIGVPMTYPPEPVNGYLVSGLETPGAGARFTYPAELAEELRRAMGGYDIHGDFLGHATPEAYLERLLEMVDNQARAACYLLAKYPADLSVVVIGATDRAQHCFWKFSDPSHPRYDPHAPQALSQALPRVYRRVDAAVGAMLEHVPDPKTVLVMSDHGFGPCHKRVHLNGWLEWRGYMARAGGSARLFGAARSAWQGVGTYAPRWLKDWLKSAFPSMRRQVESFLLLSRVEWERTKAFSISTQHGYIYLHRRDRFPKGTVAPGAEAEALCDQLIADLERFTDPETGEPVVARVVRTRDIYPGPAMESLPDLIVLWRPGYIARAEGKERPHGNSPGDFIDQDLRTGDIERLISVEQSGSHTPEGILIAHGPGLARPGEISGANIIDLAPTLLHLLGEPVPQDMGGHVLESLFAPAMVAARPVQYARERPREEAPASPYSAEEAKQVEQHLRELGYLD
jgi:predicted AlkP superfamily phosphohydrolase/phosphomutase